MYRILGRSSGNLVEIEVQRRLTPEDFRTLGPKLQALVATHDKLRVLLQLEQLEAFEGEGLWDEESFSLDVARDLERAALVVRPEHEERALRVFAPLAERARAFRPAQAEDAWRWVSTPAP